MQGKMRLGGMQPAEITCELPCVFEVLNSIEKDTYTIFFAKMIDTMGEGEIIWWSQKIISINGKIRNLTVDPSCRKLWYTFTVRNQMMPWIEQKSW